MSVGLLSKQCFVCRQACAVQSMTARQMCVGVTLTNEHQYFFPDQHRTYGLVDLCPPCALFYDEEEFTRTQRRRLLFFGGLCCVAGWIFVGTFGLIEAALCTAIGAVIQHRLHRRRVQSIRSFQHEMALYSAQWNGSAHSE